MSDVCPENVCDGSGFIFDEKARTARPCKCRPRRVARKKSQRLATVIPARYRGVSFDRPPVSNMNPHVIEAVRSYCNDIDDHLDNGRGIWFFGSNGTGKTTLAMLVSMEGLKRGHSVAIYSLPRLLGMLRGTFNESAQSSLETLIDRLTVVDMLHIDDVGAEQTSEWVLEQLYTIINTRYEERRAVVITTNLDIEQLTDQIGARTVSRLVEMCGEPIPLFGIDNRMEADLGPPLPDPEISRRAEVTREMSSSRPTLNMPWPER